ncbi:unnamed protein product, partial [Ceratitis capitata]
MSDLFLRGRNWRYNDLETTSSYSLSGKVVAFSGGGKLLSFWNGISLTLPLNLRKYTNFNVKGSSDHLRRR